MSRYSIWDKQSDIYTPNGKKFTAEQWKEMYPVAELENVKVVCGGGTFNGAIFGIFADMVSSNAKKGCDFSVCETEQDYLDAIEAFEDVLNAPSTEVSADERIAAALEAQVMMSMEDVEV